MTLQTILLSAAAIVATAVLVATFILPRHVQVERTALIDASATELQALVASNTGYQVFNPYKDTDPALNVELFGPESGVGSGFRFNGKDGKGSQTVAAVVPGRSVTMNIDLGPMGQPVQEFEFEAAGDKTRVTWTMDADMGFNPIGRVIGLFMDGMIGPIFERGLGNLARVTA